MCAYAFYSLLSHFTSPVDNFFKLDVRWIMVNAAAFIANCLPISADHNATIRKIIRAGKASISYNQSAIRWLGIRLENNKLEFIDAVINLGISPGSVASLQRAVIQSVATYGIELDSITKQQFTP
jgi:hypothetical protein